MGTTGGWASMTMVSPPHFLHQGTKHYRHPEMASPTQSTDSSPAQSTYFSERIQWMDKPKSHLKQDEDSLWVGVLGVRLQCYNG